MIMEIRSDGLYISGYVNIPGRESRPLITRHGKVNEVIEQRAFQRAIERAKKIDLLLDHETKLAGTEERTLQVYEDEVGLRAEATITDQTVIEAAKKKQLKGWSFNMFGVKDEVEQRADKLPLRKVKEFDMSEITLVMRKNPAYSSTSIEIRAGEEMEIEYRAEEKEIELIEQKEDKQKQGQEPKALDLFLYKNKINALKARKI